MRRVFLCSIQAATVLAALWLDWVMASDPGRKAEPGAALIIGVLFALIFTLIFLMFEQGVHDFKRWRNRASSQSTRVEPVFTELPDNPVSGGRISRDSRPRIGK